jgi:hypothetical protein
MTRVDRSALDHDLKRLLGEVAREALLPTGVLDIPDGWVTSRPRWSDRAGRTLAVLTVAAAGVVLALQLSTLLIGTRLSDPGAAADIVDLPATQVLQTRDGFLAVRFSPSRHSTLQLLLVTSSGQSSLLAEGVVSDDAFRPGVISDTVFHVSCAPSAGLVRSNLVFGYIGMAGAFPDSIRLSARASGTWHDGLFVFALDSSQTPTGAVSLVAASAAKPEVGVVDTINPSAFDHADSCRATEVSAD